MRGQVLVAEPLVVRARPPTAIAAFVPVRSPVRIEPCDLMILHYSLHFLQEWAPQLHARLAHAEPGIILLGVCAYDSRTCGTLDAAFVSRSYLEKIPACGTISRDTSAGRRSGPLIHPLQPVDQLLRQVFFRFRPQQPSLCARILLYAGGEVN
jgi:hypothetical protein